MGFRFNRDAKSRVRRQVREGSVKFCDELSEQHEMSETHRGKQWLAEGLELANDSRTEVN